MDFPMSDYQDLVHGTGEWRNLQEVIRKTFSSMLRSFQAQNADLTEQRLEIKSLKHEIMELKAKLSEKSSRKELQEAESTLFTDSSRRIMNLERECRSLKQTVSELRSQLNNSPSMTQLEESCQKLFAKNIKSCVPLSNAGVSKDSLHRIELDLQSLRHRFEESIAMSKNMSSTVKDSTVQLNYMKQSLKELEQQLVERPTKQIIEQRLQLKVNKNRILSHRWVACHNCDCPSSTGKYF
jgi:hypothetical protein